MSDRRYWQSNLFPYLLAAAVTTLGLFIQHHIDDVLGTRHPFAVLYFAVALCSWIGGLPGGLAATALSLVFGGYFLMARTKGEFFEVFDARLSILLFALNSILTSWLFGLIHRAMKILRRAHHRVEESDERFRQIADNIRDQIFYIANATHDQMLYLSPSFERIWGISLEQQFEEPFGFISQIHPDDRATLKDAFDRQTDGEQTSTEFRFFHPDGSLHWILDRAFPVRDSKGQVCRVAGISEDITFKKEYEMGREKLMQEIATSEEKYRFLFKSNPQPMWILDRETMGFLEVNEAAVRAFGYSREELLQMGLPDLDHDIAKFKRLPDLSRSGRVLGYRTIRRKDGSEIHIEVNASDITYEGRAARLSSLTDVTELTRARRLADEASQAKSRFLANMSHEIRTPLGAILGFAELMADPSQTGAERHDCISTILRNGVQLSTVINDILDLSKIESDKLEIERLPFQPVQIVEDVVQLLRMQAKAKGLDLTVTSVGPLPFRICSDPTRVKQILINIIGNAIKFTKAGKVEVRVAQVSKGENEFLRFVVKDNGPGISDEHRKKLFQAFMQADCSTTRLFGGTGLGLTLSKKLASALGGDVKLLESQVGVGTSFEILISIGTKHELEMLAKAAREEDLAKGNKTKGSASAADLTSAGLLDGLRVLLAEDAPDNRILVTRFITGVGAQVSCVDNGEDAVSETLHGRYDVILMDIQMPKMDGLHAVENLRLHHYDGPVIALTAHAMKGDRERCLEAGFDDYVVKPIDKKALIDTLARHQARGRDHGHLDPSVCERAT